MMLLPGQGRGWRGRLAEPLRGNPTGAGDAAVAALAAGLATGATARAMVQAAVAWSVRGSAPARCGRCQP